MIADDILVALDVSKHQYSVPVPTGTSVSTSTSIPSVSS
jgi:hypothetical protein